MLHRTIPTIDAPASFAVPSSTHPSCWLRFGRSTRHLPKFGGLSLLLRGYHKHFPGGTLFRIEDFDGDLKLEVNICETIGINLWHAPRLYEREERDRFCLALTPGCRVLDVGANIGIYSLLAAKRGAQVFAVEADPLNAHALRKHAALNDFSASIAVHEMAAMDREEQITLYRNPLNCGGTSLYGSEHPVVVPGRTIDSLQLPAIDVCKMDIEGAELCALRGMRDTLQRSPRMKLLIECFKDGPELVRFLRQHFQHVTLMNGRETIPETLPAYCNLWAHN